MIGVKVGVVVFRKRGEVASLDGWYVCSSCEAEVDVSIEGGGRARGGCCGGGG